MGHKKGSYWLVLLIALLGATLAFAVGFIWWSHEMYVAGMDMNLKAWIAYGVILLGASGLLAGLFKLWRKQQN